MQMQTTESSHWSSACWRSLQGCGTARECSCRLTMSLQSLRTAACSPSRISVMRRGHMIQSGMYLTSARYDSVHNTYNVDDAT